MTDALLLRMLNDFRSFLLKQNIIALAIAVVVGTALNALVKALVDDVIMAVVLSVTPGGDWQKLTWDLGPIHLGVGHFLSAVMNFVIVGIVAWRISRLMIKADKPVKDCAFCKMAIDATASRCPNCTSEQALLAAA